MEEVEEEVRGEGDNREDRQRSRRGQAAIEARTGSKARTGRTAIVAADERVLGIITDGDLRRAIAAGVDLQKSDCDAIMTTTPKTIEGNERFSEAEQVMLENKINSLVVVNEDGKLSGILQIYDIE